MSSAMGLLAMREHSQWELQRKLIDKGFALETVEQVLTGLMERGLQSDNRYAELYVRQRMEKGMGPVRIAMELRQRGVSDYLVRKYLAQDVTSWSIVLSLAWQKKYRSRPPGNTQEYAKQVRFLLHRGFESAEVHRFLRSQSSQISYDNTEQ
ncbi:MAG: hypothetical protein A3F41_06705 [Coxiella sp. RIFCSPHIGHO2_12_FULL_44_14]|nr:MAG: hypothetical protein A3F41_06705 [Coxiella sp. RIFCSPHIGHO2_12_FULL_44_14]